MLSNLIKAFVIFFFIFCPLERLFALHPQKLFRQGWTTDVIHFFVNHFLVKAGVTISALIAIYLLNGLVNPEFQSRVAAQPGWLQLAEAVLVADLGTYFVHRLSHTVPWLWRFHSIHHSVEQMDWLAAARLHPLDQVFTRTVQIIPLYLLGFSKTTFGLYLVFVAFQVMFIHANVRFKFGWLKWIISTPEFHHWHHGTNPEAYNKNFAAQFPAIDLLFGTLYLPTCKMPSSYGVSDPIPKGYFAQMLYPFQEGKQLKEE